MTSTRALKTSLFGLFCPFSMSLLFLLLTAAVNIEAEGPSPFSSLMEERQSFLIFLKFSNWFLLCQTNLLPAGKGWSCSCRNLESEHFWRPCMYCIITCIYLLFEYWIQLKRLSKEGQRGRRPTPATIAFRSLLLLWKQMQKVITTIQKIWLLPHQLQQPLPPPPPQQQQ